MEVYLSFYGQCTKNEAYIKTNKEIKYSHKELEILVILEWGMHKK